jgi:hypothetical protein
MTYHNDPQLSPGQPYDGYESSADLVVQAENPTPTLEASYQYDPWTVGSSPASDQTYSGDPGFVPAPAPDSYQASSLDPPSMPGAIDPNPTLLLSDLVQEPEPKPLSFEGNVEENGPLPILQGGKPPLPSQTDVHSAPLLGHGRTNTVPIKPPSSTADPKPRASATTIPGLAKGALLPLAHLEAKMSEAVGTLRSAIAGAVASIGAHLAALLPDHSTEPSSATTTGEDSGGTSQQPRPPSAPPPVEGSYFSLSGGGQIGAGGVGPLLLLGALALSLVLPRRDGRLSKAFCEVPRLCSALLLPLERPG